MASGGRELCVFSSSRKVSGATVRDCCCGTAAWAVGYMMRLRAQRRFDVDVGRCQRGTKSVWKDSDVRGGDASPEEGKQT
jgi:hypothetical protein